MPSALPLSIPEPGPPAGRQTAMPPRDKRAPAKGGLVPVLWEQPDNSALCKTVAPYNNSSFAESLRAAPVQCDGLWDHFCPVRSGIHISAPSPKEGALIWFLKLCGDTDLSAIQQPPCTYPEPVPGPGEEELATLMVGLMYR